MIAPISFLILSIQTDKTAIEWKPVKGAVVKQKMVLQANLQSGGDFATLTVTSTNERKCVDVKSNGNVTVEVRQMDLIVAVGGQNINQPPPQGVLSIEYTKFGEAVGLSGSVLPTPNELELAAAMRTLYPQTPVAKGETWKVSRPANAEWGTSGWESTFKFEGSETVEGRKAYKITLVHRQTAGSSGVSSTGTVWLDQQDGIELKAEYRLKNVDFGQGLKAADATVRLTRLQ